MIYFSKVKHMLLSIYFDTGQLRQIKTNHYFIQSLLTCHRLILYLCVYTFIYKIKTHVFVPTYLQTES